MSFQNAIVRARVVPSETLMRLATGDCLNTGHIGLGKEKNTISFVYTCTDILASQTPVRTSVCAGVLCPRRWITCCYTSDGIMNEFIFLG